MERFFARTRSDPPQEVELQFEDEARAVDAFGRALVLDGVVTDDLGQTFRGLDVAFGCHREEGAVLELPPDFGEMLLVLLCRKLWLMHFHPGFWQPRIGLTMARFVLLVSIRNGLRRVRSFLQGTRQAIEWILILAILLYALPVVGVLLLLHRAGILRAKVPLKPIADRA
jgi:hypothetical protein